MLIHIVQVVAQQEVKCCVYPVNDNATHYKYNNLYTVLGRIIS